MTVGKRVYSGKGAREDGAAALTHAPSCHGATT